MFALKYKEIGLKIAYYRKKNYSMETLFKIAEALNVNVNDLLEGM